MDSSAQTKQVSVLEDIVSSETQCKFQIDNLQEFSSVSFDYDGIDDGLFKKTGSSNVNQAIQLQNENVNMSPVGDIIEEEPRVAPTAYDASQVGMSMPLSQHGSRSRQQHQ